MFSAKAPMHFATGGFAGVGGGSSEISMGIGLDEGLILKHLSSKSAAKVILNQLSRTIRSLDTGS
jgi:hypothetical protein